MATVSDMVLAAAVRRAYSEGKVIAMYFILVCGLVWGCLSLYCRFCRYAAERGEPECFYRGEEPGR